MTKISQLSSIGDSLAIGDQFLIRDIDDTGSPNKSVTVSGITRALDLGTAAAPAIAFASDKNTGIYSPGADQVAVATNGTEKLIVLSNGNVGIGTSSPAGKTEIVSSGSESTLILRNASAAGSTYSELKFAPFTGTTAAAAAIRAEYYSNNFSSFAFRTTNSTSEPSTKLFIDGNGNVGIGTTSPGAKLVVTGTDALVGVFGRTGSTGSQLALTDSVSSAGIGCSSGALTFGANGYETERARIDSSGRLLVGTSSSQDKYFNASENSHLVQIESTAVTLQSSTVHGGTNTGAGAHFTFARSGGTAIGSVTAVASGDNLARLSFQGADGTEFVEAATITCNVDGTPGANDMPGRLVFSVTADGAASPTEALRISNDRSIRVSDGGHVDLGSTIGTKIGTATTQKLGFYNATPVVQPTAVADATTAVDVITQLNALLAKLRTLGIIAT